MILHDPDAADVALEMGLVDRRWLDNPGRAPITSTRPVEVIERFLERAVEARPSRLSTLGLGARPSYSPGAAGIAAERSGRSR